MNKLKDWKKKFQARLDETARQIKQFSVKDRMSESEMNVAELDEIAVRLEDFNAEASLGVSRVRRLMYTCR